MISFLVRLTGNWPGEDDPRPNNLDDVGAFANGDRVLLIAYGTDPVEAFSIPGTLIGGWNGDGTQPMVLDEDGNPTDTPLYPPTADYYELRPLGNRPDGLATDELRYSYPLGWDQRYLRPEGFYPEDNDAFGIDMRHKEFTGTWAGWGWRAEITHVAEHRAPNARAIGIYNDPDCLEYFYTTGAFQFGPSDWQVDEDGNPVDVWWTETPAGRATPSQEDTHFALLYGSAQEGHYTLPAGSSLHIKRYWEHDLGEAVRIRFLDLLRAADVDVEEISFNRLVMKRNNSEYRTTWAQIINRRFSAPQPILNRVYTAALSAELVQEEV